MIRRRLVAAIVGLLAIVLLVTGVLVVGSLRDRLVANVDQQLEARVEELAHRPGRGGFGRGGFGESPYAEQRAAFVLLDRNGEVVGAIPSGQGDDPEPLPSVRGLEAGGDPVTVRAVDEGGPRYRVVGIGLADGTLFMGMSLSDVDRMVGNAGHVLLVGGVVALLAAAAVVWLLVRQGLRPIDAMIGTAQAIAEGDLTERADVPDPATEVGHLGTALNTMLDRIEEAVDAKTASEARLRRFVADASHELRTPLTSIRGYAELYRQDPGSVGVGMARIEAEAARMGALVEDLLLLARLDQGQPLRTEPVDLGIVAADAVAAARAVDHDRPVSLAVPDHPVVVAGDPDRLRQVVDNLLANAREHTPPGTEVHVRVADAGDPSLVVGDDGPGMSLADAGRAFERFWQGEATVEHPRHGTGLGLAIVRDLVTGHGGTVDLDTAPGAGMRVAVRLPRFGGSSQGTTSPVADVEAMVGSSNHDSRGTT